MTDSLWDSEVPKKYGDILDVKWEGVRSHKRADALSRAAQFSPFAALVGFDDEISETARLTDAKKEMTEEKKEEIELALQTIISGEVESVITYFVADELKSGGAYVTVKGKVSKFKEFEKVLVMDEGSEIPVSEIMDIEIL